MPKTLEFGSENPIWGSATEGNRGGKSNGTRCTEAWRSRDPEVTRRRRRADSIGSAAAAAAAAAARRTRRWDERVRPVRVTETRKKTKTNEKQKLIRTKIVLDR